MDTNTRKEIDALLEYYRKFHHTLVTWYITLMGFVFVGVLAGDPTKITHPCIVKIVSIVFVVFCAWNFSVVSGTYSGRIVSLKKYLDDDVAPDNWRKAHYDSAAQYINDDAGQGIAFFLFIFVFFAAVDVAFICIQL